MGVDGSIARSARQVLSLDVSDMAPVPGVLEFLSKAKVNDVADVSLSASADEEIVGLDVAVDVGARVHKLKPI